MNKFLCTPRQQLKLIFNETDGVFFFLPLFTQLVQCGMTEDDRSKWRPSSLQKEFTSSILEKKTKKHQLYHRQVFLDSPLLAQKTFEISHSEYMKYAEQRGSVHFLFRYRLIPIGRNLLHSLLHPG